MTDEIKFDKRSEIWRPIKGYEGLYKVSNKGRIKSLARGYKNQYGEFGAKKEFIKTQKLNCFNKENKQERGYYVVNLAREYVKKLGGFEKLAEWGVR